jgi:YVTN family beta-propeller protein
MIPVLTWNGLCCDYLIGGVAVTPDGKQVYVTSNSVSAIDTATNMVVATVRLGISPGGSRSPRTANTPMPRFLVTLPLLW